MRHIINILFLFVSTYCFGQIPSNATKLPKTAQDTIWGSDGAAFNPSYDGTVVIKDTVYTGAIRFNDSTRVESAKGVVVFLTTVQRLALTNPSKTPIVFDTNLWSIFVYTGENWFSQ